MTLHDDAGLLPEGLPAVINSSGSPERVLTRAQWEQVPHD